MLLILCLKVYMINLIHYTNFRIKFKKSNNNETKIENQYETLLSTLILKKF